MTTLTIFAGINGAGKTTLYKSLLANNSNTNFGLRINIDEILCDFKGNKQSFSDNAKACKIALTKINECLNNKISFNWETTIFTKNSLNFIESAKANGFIINLHFIYVSDVKKAITRILSRKQNGGHFIPDHMVIGRHFHQFDNFDKILNLADNVYLYENEKCINLVGICSSKKFNYINQNCEWIKKLVNTITNETFK